MKFYRTIFLLMLSLLGCTATASPEADFWLWFQQNEDEIFNFESNQEVVFDKLAARMQKINPSLTFEFGPKEGRMRDFVISADGIKDAFPNVEKLYAAAPELKKWKVIKFRPRREPFDIKYQGISVQAASVTLSIARDGSKGAITVLIPGYTESKHETYAGIAFLLLDQALGEYDVETRVGAIDVAAPSDRYRQICSLVDLPKTFDELLGR
ncbi:hypothetical protein [Duganella radicis]|uniref:Uncharacterized protein n=1 Tax=Duganella radicis TaxID=551988 RepID=A0A6L6PCB4_9BURK|nr:hypothetical protein [Duganella radicis]MTV36708.1 hypothetical protein [Duganella radicis]